MSMIKEALIFLIGSANKPDVQTLDPYTQGVFVPKGFDLEQRNIEDKLQGRIRKRQSIVTNDLASFVNIVDSRAKDAVLAVPLFIDNRLCIAKAVFNLHPPETSDTDVVACQQGFGDDTAHLTIEKTTDFNQLCDVHNGGGLSQKSFIEFLEETQHCIDDAASLIDRVRKVTIESSNKKERLVDNHSATNSDFSDIEAKMDGAPPPREFTFSCNPYADLSHRDMSIRMQTGESDGKVVFHISIIQYELLMQEIRVEFMDLLNAFFEKGKTNVNVLIGSLKL